MGLSHGLYPFSRHRPRPKVPPARLCACSLVCNLNSILPSIDAGQPTAELCRVRRRKLRRRICAQARVLLAAPTRSNATWTMDFLQDALATGRKVRTLSIEDAYTRQMLAIEVDTSLPALRVVRVLERLRIERGLPLRTSSITAQSSLPKLWTNGPMQTRSCCTSPRWTAD